MRFDENEKLLVLLLVEKIDKFNDIRATDR